MATSLALGSHSVFSWKMISEWTLFIWMNLQWRLWPIIQVGRPGWQNLATRPKCLFVQNLTLTTVSHDELRTFHFTFQYSILLYSHCQMFRNPYEWFSSKKHYALENAYGIYNIFLVVNASINQVGVPRVGKICKFYKDLVRSVSHDDLFMNW